MKISEIYIRPLHQEDYDKIAKLINSDLTLQKEFGFQPESIPTGSQLEKDFQAWCKSHSARMFVVYKSALFMGLFTVSRLDSVSKSARLGYWIGSQFRHKGYGALIFKMMLTQLASMGITELRASVNPANIPSRKLWEKNGALRVESETENLEYQLKLPR